MKKTIKILLLLSILFTIHNSSTAQEYFEYLEPKTSNDIYKVWTITFNDELNSESVNSETFQVKNSFDRLIPVTVQIDSDRKSVVITPLQMYVPGVEYELIISNVKSNANETLSPATIMPFIIEEKKEEKKSIVKQEKETEAKPSSNQTQQPPIQSKKEAVSQTPKPSPETTTNHEGATEPNVEEQKPVHIKEIKVDISPFVSFVTVTTSNQVAAVRINGKRMHYQGDNVYDLTIPDLKSSQTITVEVYATYEANSLLDRVHHRVE